MKPEAEGMQYNSEFKEEEKVMKIIYDNCLGTGPDCVSSYQCHLDKPVKIDELFTYLNGNRNEWGVVTLDTFMGTTICKYSKGELTEVQMDIVSSILQKGCKIDIVKVSSAFSMVDYVIKVVDNENN